MLAPHPVGRRKVVDPRQVLEPIDGRLRWRDPEFMLELARRRDAHTELRLLDLLRREVIQRVRAAGVRPHVRECDLLGRALLEEQLSVRRPEHERGERAVQQALVDVLHEMTCSPVRVSIPPRERYGSMVLHVFLSTAPIAVSFSSTRMQRSSIRRDCSGS